MAGIATFEIMSQIGEPNDSRKPAIRRIPEMDSGFRGKVEVHGMGAFFSELVFPGSQDFLGMK